MEFYAFVFLAVVVSVLFAILVAKLVEKRESNLVKMRHSLLRKRARGKLPK
ncbi:hypothetical protein VPFG_00141 [Vibrio phage nt-1]|uniref:Uncharacterized protein n=1 Tax=Vibrio phage nt-1 TaxID=115992 RepID=R9TGC4_9CAUD|nr:hypothetical protein VPFG_00141 [Vibrio phage nt-1]AGN30143.1 hypothetical protein VPFG_00141 [Vibrio phage nt-1]